jgi:predicted transcriptional regulator
MSTMARLARKNLLRVEKQEQAYIYYPVYTEEEFTSRFVGRVLEDLLVSLTGPTLEGLAALSDPEAAARARALLDEITRRSEPQEEA